MITLCAAQKMDFKVLLPTYDFLKIATTEPIEHGDTINLMVELPRLKGFNRKFGIPITGVVTMLERIKNIEGDGFVKWIAHLTMLRFPRNSIDWTRIYLDWVNWWHLNRDIKVNQVKTKEVIKEYQLTTSDLNEECIKLRESMKLLKRDLEKVSGILTLSAMKPVNKQPV